MSRGNVPLNAVPGEHRSEGSFGPSGDIWLATMGNRHWISLTLGIAGSQMFHAWIRWTTLGHKINLQLLQFNYRTRARVQPSPEGNHPWDETTFSQERQTTKISPF